MTTQMKPAASPSSGRTAETRRTTERRKQAQRRLAIRVAIGVAVVAALLFAISQTGGGAGGSTAAGGAGGSTAAGGPRFDVGAPGPGAEAPTFQLPSTDGGTFDLADARGDNVLLYFQEGIMCQPCWTQVTDIEERFDEFEALGVDRLVSITVDDLELLRRKAADEDLETPVLADPGLTLAEPYETNQYGMMGTSMYGHSFILVGPDGEIRWRADYGGSPDYTMYVEPDDLLEDLRAGLAES